MTKYVTRVQLKDAQQTDYDRLNNEMEKEHFTRLELKQAAGKEQLIRFREYNYRGGSSLQEVTAAVYRAANSTGKKYSFTVMKEKYAVSA